MMFRFSSAVSVSVAVSLASSKNQILIDYHRTKHTRYRVLEAEAHHQVEEDSQVVVMKRDRELRSLLQECNTL